MKILKTVIAVTLVAAGISACQNGKKADNETAADSIVVAEDTLETMQMPELSQTFDSWKVVKVDEMDVDFDASLVINEDKTFSAHFCNTFSGGVAQVLRRPDAFNFENVARTDMMGPEELMKVEDAFAATLDKVQFFSVKDGVLQLLDAEGNVVIEAKK